MDQKPLKSLDAKTAKKLKPDTPLWVIHDGELDDKDSPVEAGDRVLFQRVIPKVTIMGGNLPHKDRSDEFLLCLRPHTGERVWLNFCNATLAPLIRAEIHIRYQRWSSVARLVLVNDGRLTKRMRTWFDNVTTICNKDENGVPFISAELIKNHVDIGIADVVCKADKGVWKP